MRGLRKTTLDRFVEEFGDMLMVLIIIIFAAFSPFLIDISEGVMSSVIIFIETERNK